MPVFSAEMCRCVAIYVLGISICISHQQSLNDSKVSSKACHVQRCPEDLCPAIDYCAKINKDFSNRNKAFIGGIMQRWPSIRVWAGDAHLDNRWILALEKLHSFHLVTWLNCQPDSSCKVLQHCLVAVLNLFIAIWTIILLRLSFIMILL